MGIKTCDEDGGAVANITAKQQNFMAWLNSKQTCSTKAGLKKTDQKQAERESDRYIRLARLLHVTNDYIIYFLFE